MSAQLQTGAPYALAPGEGRKLTWFASEFTLKASDPGLGAIEMPMARGEEPPMHIHSNEDEWFYVLEGEMAFYVGGEKLNGVAGSFVSFPRGIPHTFEILPRPPASSSSTPPAASSTCSIPPRQPLTRPPGR